MPYEPAEPAIDDDQFADFGRHDDTEFFTCT
jgi:hypothetical protein